MINWKVTLLRKSVTDPLSAEKGSLKLRQGLSVMIPNFCHTSSEQQQTGPPDLKVWRCWKNLAHSSAMGHVTPLQKHTLTQCSRSPCSQRWSLFWKTDLAALCLYTGWHAGPISPSWAGEAEFAITPETAAAFLLSRAESPWWQRRLQAPGEVLKHFRCCSLKKLETQLITEIALWLNTLPSHSLQCRITSPCLKLFYQVFP